MYGVALVCKARTLELEISNQAVRDRWLKALKEALIFIKVIVCSVPPLT
jgi:hypothetical protein